MKKVVLFIILLSVQAYSQIMTPEKVVSMISNRFSTIKGFSANFDGKKWRKSFLWQCYNKKS
ncbi:hypothetical protein OFQ49_05145 [Brachyspira hyodysenteriae]|nr:hypothetical protein [Brachyspira hyodysenteriae]MCZ9886198.1 hypothetical protein [Brachyspira hyodysenteriae]MCZ9938668.1 hypothetical protein [Brachyspira hyodysenteriae]